jgi:hypothetical protein
LAPQEGEAYIWFAMVFSLFIAKIGHMFLRFEVVKKVAQAHGSHLSVEPRLRTFISQLLLMLLLKGTVAQA